MANIEARMLPFCYEAGLVSGHVPDAAYFMSVATETFIKEVMAAVFSRTRSNGPGDSGNAGFGPGGSWVQTHKYKRQLGREEEAFTRGETSRDKSGLLPIEAKAAGERGPLGMADLRIALEMGDCGLANFPIITKSIMYNYREGELEDWDDYTWLDGTVPSTDDGEDKKLATNGQVSELLPNGVDHHDAMDIDNDMDWEGAESADGGFLDGLLDSCLAVG
jgi:transcriptional coactivator HFI1/ADA1